MKTNIFSILALAVIFTSCSNVEQTQVSGETKGHLDAFVEISKSTTKDIQASGVDVKNTTKLVLSLDEYKTSYPEEYAAIEGETNGWEVAKKLKRSKAFGKIALSYNLDIKSIHYIEREEI